MHPEIRPWRFGWYYYSTEAENLVSEFYGLKTNLLDHFLSECSYVGTSLSGHVNELEAIGIDNSLVEK